MKAALQVRREVLADPEMLARRVADWLSDLAIAKEGDFLICLSGGSTPRRLYRLLAEAPYRDVLPWSRIHLFWGDERFVPHEDVRSNFGMVREVLLSKVSIPAANVHPIPTDHIDPYAAAAA